MHRQKPEPFANRPQPVYGRNVAATSQPLATAAAQEMFAAGGNAVDAAIAAAVTLTVTEPTSNGIGSDAFALIWTDGKLHGFNGSGRSPMGLRAERMLGLPDMPRWGWDSVTVPGAVDSWAQIHDRFGKLPFRCLFDPAIRHAREGYPLGPITAGAWAAMRERILRNKTFATDFPEFMRHFLPKDFVPRSGEVFRSEQMAQTLEEIAATKGESFYRGRLAAAITHAASEAGADWRPDDLALHRGEWVDPISMDYAGVTIHEIPPNGQGLSTLIALGILGQLPPEWLEAENARSTHLLIEAMKIGLAEGAAHIADSAHMSVSPDRLLDPDFLARRAAGIDPKRAAPVNATPAKAFGTVNLSTADADGMMVSFIQSNFWGFGSGVVIPGTGISMQNRGYGFSTAPRHPNAVAPGKRPFHTIIPGFVTRDGKPDMAFGLMGGHMQAQGHLQMIQRIYRYGEHPQQAADAPRWQVREDFQIIHEEDFPADLIEGLHQRGHPILGSAPRILFGGMQAVQRIKEDIYTAASDVRKDGCAGISPTQP